MQAADTLRQLRAWARYLDEAKVHLYRAHGVAASAATPPAEAQAAEAIATATELAQATAGQMAAWLAQPPPSLDHVRTQLGDCRRCRLCQTRSTIVFGEGDPQARLMFVGEGPGADEDASGRPFVGKAGQLLDKMIAAMGQARDGVYIANVVKCRPPQNRDPEADEVAQCRPFLLQQIAVIRPSVVVTLGRPAARALLNYDGPMGRIRGAWQTLAGMDVMPTWHPAYLLRNPAAKREAWDDLKAVMARLDR